MDVYVLAQIDSDEIDGEARDLLGVLVRGSLKGKLYVDGMAFDVKLRELKVGNR